MLIAESCLHYYPKYRSINLDVLVEEGVQSRVWLKGLFHEIINTRRLKVVQMLCMVHRLCGVCSNKLLLHSKIVMNHGSGGT